MNQLCDSKIHLWLIRIIGVLVPRRLRADWRQEWEAELCYREETLAEWDNLNWRTKLDLLRRSLGAFRDAALLQPKRLEDEMFQDLRYGARMLLKNKGFTAVAALTLALGVGANTAIFSVVNAVLLRAFPYREADRLVVVWEKNQRTEQNTISPANFFDWREQNRVFEGMAAFYDAPNSLAGDGAPEEVPRQVATDNLFSVLGVNASLGRTFTPEDGQPGQTSSAMVYGSAGLGATRT